MLLIRYILRLFTLFALILIAKAIVLSPVAEGFQENLANFARSSVTMKSVTHNSPPFHQLIKDYARQYGVDYRLVYAMIKQESRFDTNAMSTQGAAGLMQVMPVSDLLDADQEDENTNDDSPINLAVPEDNIKAGVSYFASMMKLFDGSPYDDRIALALAAYNAGPARIYDAQEVAAYMGDSPKNWQSIRNALPLLSMRYYSLHKLVWTEGRPRNGYFGESRQTIHYVDNVLKYYVNYRQMYR